MLALFMELNAVPKRRRESQSFKDRDRELARRLGLGGEWLCDVTSVTDDERVSHRTGMHHDSWLKVRAVRFRLLAMAGIAKPRRRGRTKVTKGGHWREASRTWAATASPLGRLSPRQRAAVDGGPSLHRMDRCCGCLDGGEFGI